MRRFVILLVSVVMSLSAIAQSVGDAFYIYRNDGGFNAFFRDEVDSISYSYYDADSLVYDEIVTQVVYTSDSIYRIPIAAIDSVGFVQPETIYKDDAKPLVGVLFDYLVKTDSLNLTFNLSIPSTLLPKVGDKLVATDLTEKLPLGFAGVVRQVEQATDGYLVCCDSILLEEVVNQFYGVVEMTGLQSDSTASNNLSRRAHSEQTYPPFQFVIPTVNQQLDLSPIVRPKGVYNINGKAVANATINPIITGRITRVVDNILNISHYNIHAVTDVITVTKVEVVGEATNTDNLLNLSSPKNNFSIEGTRPGPWGIPIYYAFGPKFDLSGELALGTTVHANFRQTEDITFYPLAAAVGIALPGLTPLVNQVNTVNGSTELTRFDIDWAYIAGKVSARAAVVGRLGIGLAARGHNLGWVGGEAQIGAKFEAELGFDFEALSNAEKGTGFYDGLKDNAKITVMPYWGLEGKVSVVDDRYQFTFLGRDDYSFWGKKWEWDLLPKFSDTEARVSNGSNADVSANITNDCIIPYTVGFSLFDENNNRIGNPQWYEQKYWKHNGFNLPFKMTFTDLATDKKYKVYPTLRLFGFNVLASPSADLTMEIPVEISKLDMIKASYYPNHYTYNNKQYSFKYNCTTYVTLKDNTNVADWGYIYIDPDGQESEPISLKQYSGTVGDPRYAYCRNEPSGTVKLKGFVRYKDDEEIRYGEIQEFPIEYPTESSVTMTNCTFQGTENNASYQGKTYKYKSTYRYLFNASGAYWLKVGTEETGSGWSNWNNLPDYATSPVDGANALTVNYYYDDKTFSGDYDVYLKGTDATHSVSHTTSEYVTYTHSASQFTGCSYHAGTASSRAQGIMENDEENNIVINKPIY